MLLTITTTSQPATDLGFLLHKNPDRVHTFELSFGKAHVFYPEATAERCTAALLLDIDPIGLIRTRRGPAGEGGATDQMQQYVNDRPYVSSSFMSVAMGRVFGTAMTGRSKDRQELADAALPFVAKLAVLPCRRGDDFLRKLFEPLGYSVRAEHHRLDELFPEWGTGPYYSVELEHTLRLQELLKHLYVLIPVLDAEKHYWVGHDEVEKLLRRGEGWLESHPERNAIVRQYLKKQSRLTREALARLTAEEEPDPDAVQEERVEQEATIEKPLSLNEQRMHSVMQALAESGATTVIDLGCGEGKLLQRLLKEKQFTRIAGMDVSFRNLQLASDKLHLETAPPRVKEKLLLFQGSLMYRDKRFAGFGAAAVVEVIEHLDPPRLAAFERVLFEYARPNAIVITTPNVEYNARFATLPAGRFRHRDHRFEWTRAQFRSWAAGLAPRFGYAVEFRSIGPEDPELGSPTQMGFFRR